MNQRLAEHVTAAAYSLERALAQAKAKSVVTQALEVAESVPAPKTEARPLRHRGTFHAYMSAAAITNPKSAQYALKNNDDVSVGPEGILVYHEEDKRYWGVALGTRFTRRVGELFKITFMLPDGTLHARHCIVMDIKSDQHTDPTNTFTVHGEKQQRCVVEVVVEPSALPAEIKAAGNFAISQTFAGVVVREPEYLGDSRWRQAYDFQQGMVVAAK